ncbi:thiol oxidoreductase [Myxococcota bacterium]|nr:thiol oxidoreductase [Myxococcota bacterium]
MKFSFPSLLSVCLLLGCRDAPDALGPGSPVRAGGDTTVENRTSSAYAVPAAGLTSDELELHLDGDRAFDSTFVSPPSLVNPGLGPVFNNDGCSHCHIKDGRGPPVVGANGLGSPLVVRLSQSDGTPSPAFGDQFQDRATYGHEPEGTVDLAWVESTGHYGDGEPFALRRPVVTLIGLDGEPLPAGLLLSPRIPPPVFGLGLLERVPDAEIVALADPDDADGDGISGRVSRVGGVVGRFGWKADSADLDTVAAAGYAREMGVSNSRYPEANGEHELDDDVLDAAAFYTRTLAVPARAMNDPQVDRGEHAFRSMGCGDCHIETLHTGDGPVAVLRQQVIHAYTDLLLHNMGFDLADGRPEGFASGTEWRTAPLWGIGLAKTVLPDAGFLHDGRARTLAEAILWHGGEGESSRERFRLAPARSRDALIAFLQAL